MVMASGARQALAASVSALLKASIKRTATCLFCSLMTSFLIRLPSGSSYVNESQELCACARIVAECACHAAGDHRDAALMNSACRHTLMNRIDDHANTSRP